VNILIVGHGEIGSSIHKLYGDDYYYDVGYIDKDVAENVSKSPDVMHICIPYNEKFVTNVLHYIKTYTPSLTIIHSTIPYLTTRIIYDNAGTEIVHSPVMGKHPNLTKSIRTFKKIVASYTDKAIEMACAHFEELGVDTVVYNNPEESELAKMLSTTYYGTLIRFMQEVHNLCVEFNLDFDKVYKQTNEIYNEGYTKFGDTQFVRPVLEYMGDEIGGHCVTANAEILHDRDMLERFASIILGIDEADVTQDE